MNGNGRSDLKIYRVKDDTKDNFDDIIHNYDVKYDTIHYQLCNTLNNHM